MGLRVIVSPAKRMRPGRDEVAARAVPSLTGRSRELLAALLAMGEGELRRLWKVGDRLLASCLADLAALREAGLPGDEDELARPSVARLASPALLSYDGIQYRSMAPDVMTDGELAWCQEHLRILSGLYGCLRPLDAVLPHRLEMGARLAVGAARDLYGFWGDAIARAVVADEGEPVVANLASVEYARAVLPRLPEGVPVVTCVFAEEVRDGRPVQRATAAKAARGSMVRWMAERGVRDAGELASFDVGYRLEPGLGEPGRLVFLRDAR